MPLEMVRELVDDGSIPIRKLREGQVAEIVKWAEWSRYVGEAVKRHPMSIVGVTFDNTWSDVPEVDDVRVRVLPNGTLLKVVNNE